MYFLLIFLEQFDGILRSFPASSPMPNTEQLIGVNEIIEGSVAITFFWMKYVRKVEKEDWYQNIGDEDDECELS